MSNIKVYNGKMEIPYKAFVFNGGEVSVKFPPIHNFEGLTILARIQNSNDFFYLANVKDALERIGCKGIKLLMPYCPYARQDRLCSKGESFSLKVFSKLLNSLNFEVVTIIDPHSDVTSSLIENVKIFTQIDVINFPEITKFFTFQDRLIFVSPDAGANKKTSDIAAYFEHNKFLRADKLRDLQTGKILEMIVYSDDLTGLNVAICDDILDGGATFCMLAKALKQKKASKVILYVTHGIFASGLDKLFESGIDEIITTNSFKTDFQNDQRLKVVDIIPHVL
jgi:ribose-phosphate pyrophosphokinase